MRWHSQPEKKEKGKLWQIPGLKGKGKGMRDPAEAGGSVATKGEAAKAAGRKGPTNGVTEGSSGSCRRHAQRKKQPGQRLMHSLSSEISDSGNARNIQRKIGGNTRWEQQTNKRGKGEAQAPEEFLHERCLVTLGGYAGLEGEEGEKGKEA